MSRRLIDFIEPCQRSAAPKLPSGTSWLQEIKHDGHRMMTPRDGRRVRLFARNRNDWSELFPAVVTAVEQLDISSRLIDDEIVACDEQVLAIFDLLRQGSRIKPEAHLYGGKRGS
jgi:bifunctional non-homologous end joining protein LigD